MTGVWLATADGPLVQRPWLAALAGDLCRQSLPATLAGSPGLPICGSVQLVASVQQLVSIKHPGRWPRALACYAGPGMGRGHYYPGTPAKHASPVGTLAPWMLARDSTLPGNAGNACRACCMGTLEGDADKVSGQ